MKQFLLDTHVVLWLLSDPESVPHTIRKDVSDAENVVYVSVVSLWEMVLKQSIGKLVIPKGIEQAIEKTGFTFLSLKPEHILPLQKLPKYHNDPFDRILVCQAKVEKLHFITADRKLQKYLHKKVIII